MAGFLRQAGAHMIYPHLKITVFKNLGSNAYGEASYGPGFGERCAPVRLRFQSATTTVRTDSAGSRGHAQEEVADVRVLVPIASKVAIDDMLEVTGTRLRVVAREPRYTVNGKLDHYELICDQKVAPDGHED